MLAGAGGTPDTPPVYRHAEVEDVEQGLHIEIRLREQNHIDSRADSRAKPAPDVLTDGQQQVADSQQHSGQFHFRQLGILLGKNGSNTVHVKSRSSESHLKRDAKLARITLSCVQSIGEIRRLITEKESTYSVTLIQ